MIDLHIHTQISGDSDLDYKLLQSIFPKGGVGIVEHSLASHTPKYHSSNIRKLPNFYCGIEADYFSFDDKLLIPQDMEFDYTIGACHTISDVGVFYFMWADYFQQRVKLFSLQKILENAVQDHIRITQLQPDILAHPFSIIWCQGIEIPESLFVKFFEERNKSTAIEINSRSLEDMPNKVRENIKLFYTLAKKYDTFFSYGSDAHSRAQLIMRPFCKKLIKELTLSPDDFFQPPGCRPKNRPKPES